MLKSILYGIIVLIFFEINPSNYNNYNENSISRFLNDTVTYNYELKIGEFREKLTSDFIYETYSCFLIITNLTKKEANKIIYNTIANAEKCFYNDFFSTRPNEVISVFLFKDEETYKYWAEKLFEDTEVSYYGYYKPSEKVILMNISTGGGTLVHELTHVYLRFNFPEIPVWLNEGLGSLYERCTMSNYEITGLVNWRLPSLQNSIINKTYKSLKYLFNVTEDEFYGENSGYYYAQARYFCYYLQELGLLKKFYKRFRSNYKEDSTGLLFIEEIFNKKIELIDEDFTKWVMKLKYN